MTEPRCLNCDSAIAPPARFCARCGQRTDNARLSFADIARDLMHSFVNVERGPLTFAWALLTRPGAVAREYVEGKRRRHYGPFATLAVLVGFTALAVNLSGYQLLTHDGLPAGPADLLQRHFNLLLLLQLPLLGLACALLFRRAGHSLPEHMVLAAYTLAVRAVFLAAVAAASPLGVTTAPELWQVYAFWVAWYAYFGWAASQFYRGRRIVSWALGAAAAGLGHAAIVAAIVAGSAAYDLLAAAFRH